MPKAIQPSAEPKPDREVISDLLEKLYEARAATGVYAMNIIHELMLYDLDEARAAWNDIENELNQREYNYELEQEIENEARVS